MWLFCLEKSRASEALYIPDPQGRRALPRAPETVGCQGGSGAEAGDQGEESKVGGVGDSTGEGKSILQLCLGPELLGVVFSRAFPLGSGGGHLSPGVIEEHACGIDPWPLAGAAEQVRGARVPGWRRSGGRDEEGVQRWGEERWAVGVGGEERRS